MLLLKRKQMAHLNDEMKVEEDKMEQKISAIARFFHLFTKL